MKFRASVLKEYVLVALLVLFYFSEAVNKYLIFVYGEETFLAKAIKGTLLLVCVIIILYQKKSRLNSFLLLMMVVFFVFGQLFLSPNFDGLVVVNFIKYLFPLVLFIYFNENKTTNKLSSLLVSTFEKIVFANSLLIVLGFFLNIYILKTYGGQRFGFNGLLVSSATSTYFYSIALFNYFVKYKNRVFYDIKRVVVIISVLVVGTKSLYLFLFFYFFIFTYCYFDKKTKLLVFPMILLVFLFISYFFIFEFEIFSKITQEEGVLASITSLRSNIFLYEMIPFINNNWILPNYLFGGINEISTRPQMAFFDIFYFFGILGSILYLLIYFKNYFRFKVSKIESLFFGIIFLISFISGNFFINATVVIYMIVIRESIRKYSI